MNQFQHELRARLGTNDLMLAEAAVAKSLDYPDFGELELGQYVEQYAVVLFLDIRGFTRLSMALPRSETARVLSAVIGASVERLRDYGAHINDFPGDGIMAVFTAGDHGDPAEANATALFGASHLMTEMNATLRDELLGVGIDDPVQVAIGLNSGTVRWQRIGGSECNRLMAIGEVAPIAAKFATSRHTKAWELLIGGQIAEDVPDAYKVTKPDLTRTYDGREMRRKCFLLDWSGMYRELPSLAEAQILTTTAAQRRQSTSALAGTLAPSVVRQGSGGRRDSGVG
jgi:class 3 adenylate cyclase